MSLYIKTLSDRSFSINGKVLHKDMNDKWVTDEQLTEKETRKAKEWIAALEEDTTNAIAKSI